jgi:hypothetical protein
MLGQLEYAAFLRRFQHCIFLPSAITAETRSRNCSDGSARQSEPLRQTLPILFAGGTPGFL